jgi:YesN/AraC family two-component response regulator
MIILSDINMPVMDGLKPLLAVKVRKIRPRMVISAVNDFSSGSTQLFNITIVALSYKS